MFTIPASTCTCTHASTCTYLHAPIVRDGLLLEVEALQESSSKLNEERIFELKQRIEDLLMENDTMTAQNQTLKREVGSLR